MMTEFFTTFVKMMNEKRDKMYKMRYFHPIPISNIYVSREKVCSRRFQARKVRNKKCRCLYCADTDTVCVPSARWSHTRSKQSDQS